MKGERETWVGTDQDREKKRENEKGTYRQTDIDKYIDRHER